MHHCAEGAWGLRWRRDCRPSPSWGDSHVLPGATANGRQLVFRFWCSRLPSRHTFPSSAGVARSEAGVIFPDGSTGSPRLSQEWRLPFCRSPSAVTLLMARWWESRVVPGVVPASSESWLFRMSPACTATRHPCQGWSESRSAAGSVRGFEPKASVPRSSDGALSRCLYPMTFHRGEGSGELWGESVAVFDESEFFPGVREMMRRVRPSVWRLGRSEPTCTSWDAASP